MNMVNSTALANLRQNKGKNILTGIAVFLTAILIFTISALGLGVADLQLAAVNKIYPSYHAMFRNVDVQTATELSHRAEVDTLGLRQDTAQIVIPDGTAPMIYMDDTALQLGKTELESGEFPQSGNEIAVSRGLLRILGITAEPGDTISLPYQPLENGGLGYEKKGEFVIRGILPTTKEQEENGIYSALISKDFMESEQPEASRKYYAMFRISGADSMDKYEILDICKKLAGSMGISEGSIAENSAYLTANYIDPALFSGIAGILLVVILAGIITIYSIYYVSMIYKVQEFGKLKALGATKRQIRKIVFREGILTACLAIPAGLLFGSLLSQLSMQYLLSSFYSDELMGIVMAQLLHDHEVVILKPWIYLMTAAVTLLTVTLSMLRPMKISSRISPVEAMRYDGGLNTNKKLRRGHTDINLVSLTAANLSRNKKRSVITVATLGITGILFMTVSAILTCADPAEITKDAMPYEYCISVDSRRNDKMHPEQKWSAICQNNPLNEQLEEELYKIPGVERIIKQGLLNVELPELKDGEDPWQSTIAGIPEDSSALLESSIVNGSCTYSELEKGDKIIMSRHMLHWAPDWKPGDEIRMIIENGSNTIEKTFVIAAIADMPEGLSLNSSFVLPQEVIDSIASYNMDYYWSVSADKGQLKSIDTQIRSLMEKEDFLQIKSYEDELAYNQTNTSFLSQVCYAFMGILGGVGIMNLINTMINSIYVRRRELGIMQAIGMSEKQLVRLLQMEGLFYTAGTLAVSLGFGSIFGYLAFLYARNTGMFGIISYHYPAAQSFVLVAAITVIQLLLTYLITRNFRRQSMIERIRFSE